MTTLDQIFDAASRLAGKHPSQLSDEELGITCAASDPNLASFLRGWIAEFGFPPKAVSNEFAGTGDSTGDLKMDSAKDFIDAQAAAEPTYRAFGDSAPPRMQGESLPDYEGRLVRPHQQFSKTFKDADLAKIGCPITRRALAAEIYKDALQEAVHPTALSLRPGELRAVIKYDGAGRPITSYVASDDGALWDRINPPIRRVRRIITPGTPLAS